MGLIQYAFRFFSDDGSELTSSVYAAENAAAALPLDANIVVRIGVTHDGSAVPSASTYLLFAAPVGTEAWFEVSATGSGKVKLWPSGGSPNNIPGGSQATSSRLSAPSISPTPTFTAGQLIDANGIAAPVSIGNGQYTELGWCIRLVSANGAQNGEQYKFRALRIPGAEGSPTDGGGGSGDPNWANLSLSIFNESNANGSTSYVDQSANGFTPISVLTPTWSDAQTVDGRNSVRFENDTAVGDGIRFASNAAFGFGTGDFTWHTWWRTDALATGVQMIFEFVGSGVVAELYVNPDGSIGVWLDDNDAILTGSGVLSNNTWYHLAVTRSGSTVRLFVDGSQVGSATDAENLDAARAVRIGISNDDGSAGFNSAWMAGAQVYKGVAVWTAGFTPPTLPRPTGA